jgi:hypothetical protein
MPHYLLGHYSMPKDNYNIGQTKELPPDIVNQIHAKSDKDTSSIAQHHTLGPKKNQASPGDHVHDGNGSIKYQFNASVFDTNQVINIVNETVAVSLSFAFRAGRAYRLEYFVRVTMQGGTSPYAPFPRLRRANVTGTVISNPGATTVLTTNNGAIQGTVYLKRTGDTDTTQTVVLCVNKNTTGSPTTMSINGFSDAPTYIVIEEVGSADDFTGATEIPTS